MKRFTRLALSIALIFGATGFVPSNFGWLVDKHAAWCTGADGALSLNGTDVHIPAGSKKDYSSITLINSAHLIIDPGTGWTQICVAGNLTINTSSAIVADNAETIYGDTIYKTAEDGTALSYLYNAIYGGQGGLGGNGSSGGAGPGFASGGGGGGQGTGNDATLLNGGDGAGGGGDSGCDPAFGGIGPGGAGGTGTDCLGNGGATSGVGGGGGARGFHGASVYLKITGVAAVTGTAFSSNGGVGGAGGNGTSGSDPTGCGYGGGGGGGGSGGSGGSWIIKYHLGSIVSGNISTNAGNGSGGGSGAAGGTAPPFGTDCGDGTFGDDGQNGNAGTSTITTF